MPPNKKELVDCAAQFYERRWMWGTAGNLSLRIKSDPLEILITPSGLNKGRLKASDLLTIQDGRTPKHPKGYQPSAETEIHQAIYRAIPEAQAAFHVHAIYATLFSTVAGDAKKISFGAVPWFEMMKCYGIPEGETTQIPILPNWQDISKVADDFTRLIQKQKSEGTRILPVILLQNHGMTAWGKTPDQARNHLEVMEYVCQYLYLQKTA